uniref:Putative metalloprotease n=1 Tax=Ixodes ricinus TaxID=34613 RepID=A0A0K8RAJ4_IXORI
MANNRSSPDKHTLSNCSKRNIQHKLQTIENCSCLRTGFSRPVNPTYLPSDFLNEADTCTLKNQNYKFCNLFGRENTKPFVVNCSIACCELPAAEIDKLSAVILAPDGTKSEQCQLCLAGKCTNHVLNKHRGDDSGE